MAQIGRGRTVHAAPTAPPLRTAAARDVDARSVLPILLAVQITLMAGPAPAWTVAALVTVATAVYGRVALHPVLRAMRGFLLLAAVIVLSHVLFSDRPGALLDGTILAGRLLSVVAAGVVFAAYLDVDEVARALGWYLRPVLGRRAARVALMTRLALRSVVLLRRDLSACRTALTSRGLTVRARPLRYLALLGSNAVVHALMRADHHSEAVTSRGYADTHVPFPRRGGSPTGRRAALEWTWTATAVAGCAAAWIGALVI